MGVSLKGVYSQNVTDKEEKGILIIQSDTTVSETTAVEVMEAVSEKVTQTTGKFVLPIGIEITLHPKAFLRFGVTSRVIREERKVELNHQEITKSTNQSLTFDYSLGLGYQLSKDLRLDLLTKNELSSITSWEVGAIYRF